MKRDPSIHVRLSVLERVLRDSFMIDLKPSDIIPLMSALRQDSCDNRSVTVTNDKLKRDTDRRLKTNKGDANLMSDIIYSVRIKLKHRGVRKIKENDREWLQLKELTKLANQFADDFHLEKRDAYLSYINMGMTKISSFRSLINKFISMYETICNEYESLKDLEEDDKPELTKQASEYFVNKIAERTGIYEPFKNKSKFAIFFKLRKLCDELGVDSETFIDAQFEALDWCNGIPTPESLIGDKSKERLNKYLFTNGIKIKTKEETSFWQSLKKR